MIGTFAVAYPLIRYSAEAKPYGSDMLVTLLLLVLLVEWRIAANRTRWLWALALAMPVALLLSYHGHVRGAGGDLCEVHRTLPQRHGAAGALGLVCTSLNLLAAGGLALLFWASARGQLDAAGPHMRNGCAVQAFPPLHSAKELAMFLLESHTSEAFAYPAGGARGRKFADDHLLPDRPGAAAPRTANLAGHPLHCSAGFELYGRCPAWPIPTPGIHA